MKKAFALLLALIIAAVSCTVSALPEEEPSCRDAVGMSISGFHSYDLYHNPIDDSILQNADVTVINYWATWCGPCLGELPDFKRLYNYYQSTPEADVQIYGLLMYDYSEEIPEAIQIFESNGYEWTNILRTPLFYSIAEALTGDGSVVVPQTIIVDRTGTVRAHMRGRFFDYPELYNYVNGWYEIISAEQPPAPVTPGDVDGNGTVNSADALLVLRYTLGMADSSALLLDAADADGNGTVNSADALIILRLVLGLG